MPYSKRKPDPNIVRLIEEIENHECLWNVHNKEYNSKGLMARAWVEIAATLRCKVHNIRAKWKNLKDAFRKEVKKNFVDDEYRGIWVYFEKMDFLRSVMDLGDKNEMEISESYTLDDTQSLSDEEAISNNDNTSQPPVKRRKVEEYDSNAMFLHINEDVVIDPKTSEVDEEALYDEQFLISLLPFFKRLDPVRKLMIRSKIQAAVVEELTQSNRDPIGN